MTDCGTVGKLLMPTNSGRIIWEIPNFKSLSQRVGDFYWSPEMQHLDNIWNLRVYLRGTSSIPGCILLHVQRKVKSDVKPVRFSLGICDEYGFGEDIICNQGPYETSFCSGLLKFIEYAELQRSYIQFVPWGKLFIIFSMWIDELPFVEGKELVSHDVRTENVSDTEAVKTREHLNIKDDNSTLRKHMEDMLLSGDDHDVTIKVKDQQFRAHKCMLRARSPVFAAMFKHEMKESMNDSVSIDDCDPKFFDEFLYYVYTEKVKNLSVSNAMGLYYAGDKYDFSGLKKICVEFLKDSLSTTIISDVITMAIKHGERELLERAMSFFSKHLEEIMITVEWQRFLQDNPIQANELCLKAVKTSYKKIE